MRPLPDWTLGIIIARDSLRRRTTSRPAAATTAEPDRATAAPKCRRRRAATVRVEAQRLHHRSTGAAEPEHARRAARHRRVEGLTGSRAAAREATTAGTAGVLARLRRAARGRARLTRRAERGAPSGAAAATAKLRHARTGTATTAGTRGDVALRSAAATAGDDHAIGELVAALANVGRAAAVDRDRGIARAAAVETVHAADDDHERLAGCDDDVTACRSTEPAESARALRAERFDPDAGHARGNDIRLHRARRREGHRGRNRCIAALALAGDARLIGVARVLARAAIVLIGLEIDTDAAFGIGSRDIVAASRLLAGGAQLAIARMKRFSTSGARFSHVHRINDEISVDRADHRTDNSRHYSR
jgi:hypothetical protein